MWNILPDVPHEDRHSFIRQVEERLKSREFKTWSEEWPSIWRKITVAECIQFLVYSIENHGFSYIPDKEATDIFNSLVDNYSVAQIFKLIDKATKDFADFARQQRWSMKAARVVEKIRKNEEYYRSQGWTVFSFSKRPNILPQSAISRIFFYIVLGIGEDGFLKAPRDLTPLQL